MSDELKPVRCGCGGEARIDAYLGDLRRSNLYYIYCAKCDIRTSNYLSEAEAIEAWNKAMGASAESERKKGEWNFIGDNMFECTHCGVVYTTQQLNGLRNYDVDPYAPRFCPNCGADMRTNENEKDER